MATPEQERIYKAALRGDSGPIQEAIQQAISHLVGGSFGPHDKTPLHAAAREGHVDAVRVLTSAGADPNVKDRYGRTPLHDACLGHSDRRADIVRILLGAGADPNAQDGWGNTPFHHCADWGARIEIVNLMLGRGANPNIKNNAGSTPLHSAAEDATVKVVRHMVENDADMRVVDKVGMTCLHFAGYNTRNAGVATFFLENGADDYLNATDCFGQTPLRLACTHGSLDVVNRFLAIDGVDLQAKDNDGITPLHRASYKGYLDVVQALVQRGANIYAKDNRENTPLDKAFLNHHADTVDYLLQQYRETIIGQVGDLCLHSVFQGVRYKKNNDEDDDNNDEDDNNNDEDDDNNDDNHNDDDNDEDVMVLLPIGTRTMDQMMLLMEQFVTHHPNCNRATNDDGELALHVACASVGPVQVVRFLVGQYPGSIHMLDNNGATPLHVACRSPCASKKVLRFLVEEVGGGVDTLMVRDGQGALPLHVLCASDDASDDLAVKEVEYLMQKNSQALNEKTTRGDLPILVACEHAASLSVVYALMRAHPSALINGQ